MLTKGYLSPFEVLIRIFHRENEAEKWTLNKKWSSLQGKKTKEENKIIDWCHTCVFWCCMSTAKLVKWFVWQTVRLELASVVTPSFAHKLWRNQKEKIICHRILQSDNCASFKTVTKQPTEMVRVHSSRVQVCIYWAMYVLVNLTNSAVHSI